MIKGVEGFGAHSRIHTAKILMLCENLPIIIDIIDSKEKIELILPHLDEMIIEGMVTLEDIDIIMYRNNSG